MHDSSATALRAGCTRVQFIGSASAAILLAATGAFGQSGPILWQNDGQSSFQAFGAILAGSGDLDGDGVPDLLVGCSEYGSSSGSAKAISGATGAVLYSWSAATHSDGIADAGDVDADGVTDVLVGDTFASPNFAAEGSAWVYSGATGAQLYRFNGGGPQRYLGADVGGVGDVNGDGRSDVIIGAWGETGFAGFSGVVYVRSGADGSQIHRIQGTVDHGYFGSSVTGVADTNGDGVPDFAIGAYNENELGHGTGAVYLYSGTTGAQLRKWTGEEFAANFGNQVRAAGDADGDGRGDLVVGSRFAGVNGRAYLLSGATGASLRTWSGYHPDEVFGASVDGAGDLDGDGKDDVVVGSDRYYVVSGWTGFVRAFSSATGELLHDFRGGSATARLGIAVTGVGDVNGDGIPDLAAGAIDEATPSGGAKSGRVFLFSGQRAGLLHDISPFDGGALSTFRVAGGQPGSLAVFAVSLAGSAPFASPFGTIHLSLPISVLATLPFTAQGTSQFQVFLPPSLTGVVIHSQAVEVQSPTAGAASQPLTLEMH